MTHHRLRLLPLLHAAAVWSGILENGVAAAAAGESSSLALTSVSVPSSFVGVVRPCSCSAARRRYYKSRLPNISVATYQQPVFRSSVPLLRSKKSDLYMYTDTDTVDADQYGPLDYAITDSIGLPDDRRPSLLQSISNPRDILSVLLLLSGVAVSYHNIVGRYDDAYQNWQILSILLGVSSLAATLFQLQTGYMISSRPRRGVIDDSVINLYAGLYSGCVAWLATRASTFCPKWVEMLDGIAPWIACAVFAFSLVAPIVTLVENTRTATTAATTADPEAIDNNVDTSLSAAMTRAARLTTGLTISETSALSIPPSLSETELFRTQGLIAIGVLGCVFVPDCIAFALGSSDWWDRVSADFPSQKLQESSTALFALYATEASMVATRCANKGVATYRVMVPAFAVVCLLLAIVPCVCSLYWLGDDVSFFSFYQD